MVFVRHASPLPRSRSAAPESAFAPLSCSDVRPSTWSAHRGSVSRLAMVRPPYRGCGQFCAFFILLFCFFTGVCARVAARRLQWHLVFVVRRIGRLWLVCELWMVHHENQITFEAVYHSSRVRVCICLLRCGASNTCSAISSQTLPQPYCGTCASQWETSCPVERLSSTDPNASGSWASWLLSVEG